MVLDPFCGRGTTPFQALLMNRQAVASDINPVAFCITRAKCRAPAASTLKSRVAELEGQCCATDYDKERLDLPEFFEYAYAPQTLNQILFLRHKLDWKGSDTDSMIAAILLCALHGESKKSPSYLSNQMPRTISTKPDYSVGYWRRHDYEPPQRDVFDLLRDRIEFRYRSVPPSNQAFVYHTDMRKISDRIADASEIRCVITSPPYFNITDFEEDQWLRLWFLGGPPHPTYNRISSDDRHTSSRQYWQMISDFWRSMGQVLGPEAHVVIRLGGKNLGPDALQERLSTSSLEADRQIQLVESRISTLKGRQTDSFCPGTKGCYLELDCHFHVT